MKKNKTSIVIAIAALSIGLLAGRLIFSGPSEQQPDDHAEHTVSETLPAETWTCSMHPQIRQPEPGDCPICGMDLIPLEDETDEGIDPDAVSMSETAMKLAGVQTIIVGKANPLKTVRLNGKVVTDERRRASQTSHIPGRIEKLMVSFTGEFVNKDQTIALLYSPELVTAQEELLEAAKVKDSYPRLFSAAKGKLKNWKLSDQQIEEIIRSGEPTLQFEIQADVSGHVTSLKVNSGDYIKRGETIYEIADFSQVWVLFEVSEQDISWVEKGDKIHFTVQSLPGVTFEEEITYIDPVIDPDTRVAMARVETDNSNLRLKPEMFASGVVEAKLTEKSDQISVPKTAVMWTGKRSLVYVKNTSEAGVSFMIREVVLGPSLGDRFIIENGLKEGEEIASSGTFSIDAAAQLAGKPSMMSPEGGRVNTGHDHGSITTTDYPDPQDMHNQTEHDSHHASFAVAGNCGMCKERIENAALSVSGVSFAHWDAATQILHLDFDPAKTDVDEVQKAIAQAGHDTEKFSAPDQVYQELPGCCLYERFTY